MDSNPFLTRGIEDVKRGEQAMTLNGTIHRTGILLLICLFSGYYAWTNNLSLGAALVAVLTAFVLAMVGIFKAEWTPVIAPGYACLEGLALGSISLLYNTKYPGIALNAGLLTATVLFCMLGLYYTRIVKVTQQLYTGIIAATFAVAVVYGIDLLLNFWGLKVPFIHDTGWLGITVSLITTGIASANLLLDFDMIERGINDRQPKYMQWYCGMGLLITLVWVYLELLRLLSKFGKR